MDYFDREVARQPFDLADLILCELLPGVRDDQSFPQYLRSSDNSNCLKRMEEAPPSKPPEISASFANEDIRCARPLTA